MCVCVRERERERECVCTCDDITYSIFTATDTQVVIGQVKAGPSIETRLPQFTIIHINLALSSYKTFHACAVETIEEILRKR